MSQRGGIAKGALSPPSWQSRISSPLIDVGRRAHQAQNARARWSTRGKRCEKRATSCFQGRPAARSRCCLLRKSASQGCLTRVRTPQCFISETPQPALPRTYPVRHLEPIASRHAIVAHARWGARRPRRLKQPTRNAATSGCLPSRFVPRWRELPRPCTPVREPHTICMTVARAAPAMIALLLALLAATPACTASAPPPPAKAVTQKKAERDPNGERDRDREPRHVAPPPAYGNKVVLAQATEGDSSG